MADNMHFASREKLEVFIRQNPKRFLEELERSPDLRNNFQQLLQDWNNGDLIQIAQLLQGMEVRNPINNKLMIVEEKAKSFYHWSFNELREVQQNPYHKLTSFQHYLQETMKKREELEEEEEKARLKKDKEHKIQTKLDKEKLEQEKRNMDIVMKSIEAQFKQSLRSLFADIDKKAMLTFNKDIDDKTKNLETDNPEADQQLKKWQETTFQILKNYPEGNLLNGIMTSISMKVITASKNEEELEKLSRLLESLGLNDARERLERVANGTETENDIKLIQTTFVNNKHDKKVTKYLNYDIGKVSSGNEHNIVVAKKEVEASVNKLRELIKEREDYKQEGNVNINQNAQDVAIASLNNVRGMTDKTNDFNIEAIYNNVDNDVDKIKIRNKL